MSDMLNEVFDENSVLNYAVIDLKPKYKVPQVWHFGVPGTDSLMARLMQFTGKETVKQFKRGDNIAEVFLMSGTSKGHAVPLKGGLGTKPVDAIHLIFKTVWASIKPTKPDVVLFRFPSKKMKGQQFAIIRIMERLVKQNTGGRYQVLKEANGIGNKNAYVIMYRKGVELLSVDGMPPIPEKYQKTETKVGDVYTNTEKGEQVSKNEIAAEILVKAADKKQDTSVAQQTKFSRRQLARVFGFNGGVVDEDWEKYEASAAQFTKPASGKPVDDNGIIQNNSQPHKLTASVNASRGAWAILNAMKVDTTTPANVALRKFIEGHLEPELAKHAPLSVGTIQAFSNMLLELTDVIKEKRVEGYKERYKFYIPPMGEEKPTEQEYIEQQWNSAKAKMLRKAVQDFSAKVAPSMLTLYQSYQTPGFTSAQQNAISNYCGSYYGDMNNYLLGKYTEQNGDYPLPIIKKTIDNLDAAFENGVTLPEGLTLWRGQRLPGDKWKELVKNRVFYFRNFVSTSTAPIIFGGWQVNSVVAITKPEFRDAVNLQTPEEITPVHGAFDDEGNPILNDASIGWAISGAHKINVILPGKLSPFANEQEIILPRGTALEIDEIIDASHDAAGMKYENQKMVKATILNSTQLAEAVEVLDGDLFMETGELRTMDGDVPEPSFEAFLTSSADVSKKGKKQFMASLMALDEVNPKFMM